MNAGSRSPIQASASRPSRKRSSIEARVTSLAYVADSSCIDLVRKDLVRTEFGDSFGSVVILIPILDSSGKPCVKPRVSAGAGVYTDSPDWQPVQAVN